MSRVLPILFNTDMVRAILDERKTVTRRVVKPQPQGYFEVNEEPLYIYDTDFRQGRIMPPYQPGDILYVRETWQYCYELDENDQIIEGAGKYVYAASPESVPQFTHWVRDDGTHADVMPWHPSIHMPKKAARIWLKVTDVRVERLQEITEDQAEKEGLSRLYDDMPDNEYSEWLIRTGIYPKSKEEWGYKNYLWHGNFGECGTGNWKSDCWEYQYSSYDNAVGSFSSLWNSTKKKSDLDRYGWDANPWVWVIEFERCEKPKEY